MFPTMRYLTLLSLFLALSGCLGNQTSTDSVRPNDVVMEVLFAEALKDAVEYTSDQTAQNTHPKPATDSDTLNYPTTSSTTQTSSTTASSTTTTSAEKTVECKAIGDARSQSDCDRGYCPGDNQICRYIKGTIMRQAQCTCLTPKN